MHLSETFIKRPVATTLLALWILLLGAVAYKLLPVAALPQVDFPTISVQANLPGANPETMAATVATPLERSLGQISGVTEISSTSSLGLTRITLQFDMSRNIDGAARDVQAAINASRNLLPTSLPNTPVYRKVNPSDAPIMILALTSETLSRGQMYDAASTILAQKISRLKGIGMVTVGGGSLPAVRVLLNPNAMNKYGISTEDVRAAIIATNVNRPKGSLEKKEQSWQILANDQAKIAAEYLPTIVAYRGNAPVRLSDIARVEDSVQDIRNAGQFNGKPAIMLILNREAGANIIETVDQVKNLLPNLRASIPAAMNLSVASDRTPTIRASLEGVEHALIIAIILVVFIVFLFLRDARATLIPGVAVTVSLVGTFGVMYLAGFSLNNISLMAITVATGFVVDDAVVMLENISRHIDNGIPPFEAAVKGAGEVSFTVLSMSLSLVAVFIPILLMEGIVGRLFREFSITLSAGVLISLLVSLTITPMMCARLLRPRSALAPGRFLQATDRIYQLLLHGYRVSLDWALTHGRLMLIMLLATVCLNIYLYTVIPKGFFPQQDSGRLMGAIQADQGISFQAMQEKLSTFINIISQDPAVESVVGFTGGGPVNTGRVFVGLKPLAERQVSAEKVISRLRRKLNLVPGANLFLQSVQDIRMGGRVSNAQYQYTLQADSIDELRTWEPVIRRALHTLPQLADVNTDQQDKGKNTSLIIDRDAATRLGISQRLIDTTLNNLFGQRQISTIYNPLNQYRVVMEAAPEYLQNPETLKNVLFIAPGGLQIPLAAFARWEETPTPLAINHQGQFAASTISFNLSDGVSLSEATRAIDEAMARTGAPSSIQGSFQGTAKAFQMSLANQPILVLSALVAVYLVLGILYESYIHPITILSTLPSAGVGAILALLAFKMDFSIIAMIGIILLIGIVKKNAILIIDFALEAERKRGLSPRNAIHEACILRFRPIMMTTMAALLGAVPLAVGSGMGSELRQPLGISIVGGLIVSQLLTLYTTPVIYLYLDQLRLFNKGNRKSRSGHQALKITESS